jgi:hypothetical protein
MKTIPALLSAIVAAMFVILPKASAAPGADSSAQFQFLPPEYPVKLDFHPGTYRCELERQVHVTQVSADGRSAVVRWNRRDYTLKVVEARTGALRYEDASSGLVWLVIVGKSMLLDTRAGKQLANECRI